MMLFTRYFVKSIDAYIAMSEKVMSDLREVEKNKPALLVDHPLYDNFGEPLPKEEARQYLKINPKEKKSFFSLDSSDVTRGWIYCWKR